MSTVRRVTALARADFLERTRRYSFLIMLGMVVWLGYASATGMLILRVPPNYVGEINSPWVGALMTMTATLFLGWLGFYLVKGSVARDYETGVGQMLATTPLSRSLYVLGKWLSNLAVLSLMLLILMLAGMLMALWVAADTFELAAIVAPLALISLPCMAIVAALAVLFETISWLRGGLGNVIYFFLFMVAMIPNLESQVYHPWLDFAGFRLIGDSIAAAAKVAYPESTGGYTFAIAGVVTESQIFVFEGIAWTAQLILARLVLFCSGLGMVLVAAVFFDRFDPSRVLPLKRQRRAWERPAFPRPASALSSAVPVAEVALPAQLHLTPITDARPRFRFGALIIAELKLLLKGQRWWWYLIALGLVGAQAANGPEIARMVLVAAWLWPLLLLSGLGNRELRHNTQELLFSAPRPILKQLPAAWLAAFSVIAVMGSGALLRFLLAGEVHSVCAWLGGALFIPALALALGVLTGSSKAFEVIYVIWMYIIVQQVPALDFVGVTAESPWTLYALLAPVLLVLAALVRYAALRRR